MLKVRVALRIFSRESNLDALSKIMGEPTSGFSIGDLVGGKKKTRSSYTLWCKDSSLSEDNELADHIKHLLDYMAACEVKGSMSERHLEKDMFCMIYTDCGQGGASLKPSIMSLMAEKDVSLTLDFYGDQ